MPDLDRERLIKLRRMKELKSRQNEAVAQRNREGALASEKKRAERLGIPYIPPEQMTREEIMLSGPIVRAALGASELISGPLQAGAYVGGKVAGDSALFEGITEKLREVEAVKREGMRKKGQETDVAGLVGNLVGGATALPKKIATTLGGKIAQGVGTGGALGASVPALGEDFEQEKLTQALAGAALGGAIPAGGALAKTMGDLLPGGASRSAERVIRSAAGYKQADIIKALGRGRGTGAQAAAPAGSAEFSGLENIARQRDPTKFLDIDEAGAASRLAKIREIGGTPGKLAKAQASRAEISQRYYDRAWDAVIKPDNKLNRILDNKFAEKAIGEAKELARAEGVSPDDVFKPHNLTKFLHDVKIGIDKQLSMTGNDALNKAQSRSANSIKKELVGWLKNKNIQYDQARDIYRDLSIPIDQMKVGQLLEQKLTAPLEGKERAAAFANALRDAPATLKKATGQKLNKELADILSAEDVQKLQGVRGELADVAKAQALGSKGTQAARKLTGILDPQQLPGTLNRAVLVTNNILKRTGSIRKEATMDEVSRLFQDPQSMRRLLSRATPEEAGIIRKTMQRLGRSTQALPIAAGQAAQRQYNPEEGEFYNDEPYQAAKRYYTPEEQEFYSDEP